MIAIPASSERVQKCVFNFEIYRILKKRPIYPILPYVHAAFLYPSNGSADCVQFKLIVRLGTVRYLFHLHETVSGTSNRSLPPPALPRAWFQRVATLRGREPWRRAGPRFVGRPWNAQKKRQILFDSWWCADTKNVFFIKIGRWPFSKIALWVVSNTIFFFSLATWLSHLFTRRQAFSSPTE